MAVLQLIEVHSHGVVGQIVKEFNDMNDSFLLGLAPEGTRSKTLEWKTGFLHIAKQAKVFRLFLQALIFSKKEIFFHPAIDVSGDITQELD